MAETSIERIVADRYPKEVPVKNGTSVTLTPMVPSDWNLLGEFLARIPDHERVFLRHDISSSGIVEQWCTELDYKHIFPLLAWIGGDIVADGTLHLEPGLWTSHLGRLRVLVDPSRRRLGIGALLAEELCDVGAALGLHKVVVECAAEQAELVAMLERAGFQQAARLEGFVLDRNNQLHDLLVMVRGLR
jgi:GNAT superfamily N-acetyltransferase